MRPRHAKRSLYCYANAVVFLSLSMALYTISVGSTEGERVEESQQMEATSWEPLSARSLAYEHEQAEEDFPVSSGMMQQRILAPRDRGLGVTVINARTRKTAEYNDQTAWLFAGIAGSMMCSIVLGKRAIDRWIELEDAERTVTNQGDNSDPLCILCSSTTGEIGYGMCD